MKQLIQTFKTGEIQLIEAPVPTCDPVSLVVESTCSLISIGTERTLIEFGKSSFVNKARKQPEKVKQVLQKIKTDGLITTLNAVKTKLNEPTPLGYSNVGRVIETGNLTSGFKEGDRVVSNGPHAEFVKVPWTLAAKIPDNVLDEEAAFAVLGAIALEGIRLLKPSMGETIVVIGLGLLGQLAVQLLQAQGVKVIGFDIDESRVTLARQFGVEAFLSGNKEDDLAKVNSLTHSIGADGILITASSSSADILPLSAEMCRKRGKIVLVGVVPIQAPRNLFYEKEISFQVSCSYGPGRYDPLYEEKGIDYPLPYVRWTAKRNMETFLFLVSAGKLSLQPLISHRFDFNDVHRAYNALEKESPLGIILEYAPSSKTRTKTLPLFPATSEKKNITQKQPVQVGFIGAGNFAKGVLLPALKATSCDLRILSASDGFSASIVGKRFGFKEVTSDKDYVLTSPEVNTVFIATRHASHASLTLKALQNEKHVFVEKPLAISLEELKELYQFFQNHTSPKLMVGFNRRFSPLIELVKKRLPNIPEPLSIIITINAGALPLSHWTQDPQVGGGRIIGEACHFIDLAYYLTGSRINQVAAISASGHPETDEDKVMILLTFENGSQASINYLANGNKRYPKEMIQIFGGEKIYLIENFKTLKSFGDTIHKKLLTQDKGHKNEVAEFITAIASQKEAPIPLQEIFEVHLATFAVQESLIQKRFVGLQEMWDKII